MSHLDRRSFLALTSLGLAAPSVRARTLRQATGPVGPRSPVVIASGNGSRATELALARLNEGIDPAEAVVDGVTLVEDDPNDMSVGYGGLPNEDGVVQLDASVMHGPTHKAGAVAALEGIRNPARVALEVLRRTDHVMLVGVGAKRFALAMGLTEQNMLTDRAREAWLRWKRNLNPADDWLDDDQIIGADAKDSAQAPIPFTHGTVHCAALDRNGDLGACTTTSGLSYKIPGRVGDSPIVGAGMFVDNAVGTAGGTGRGESVIQSAGAFQIVDHMARGLEPGEACLEALRYIARHTKRPELRNERSEPNFGCTYYALRKDGVYGSASLRGAVRFAVADRAGVRHERCLALYS